MGSLGAMTVGASLSPGSRPPGLTAIRRTPLHFPGSIPADRMMDSIPRSPRDKVQLAAGNKPQHQRAKPINILCSIIRADMLYSTCRETFSIIAADQGSIPWAIVLDYQRKSPTNAISVYSDVFSIDSLPNVGYGMSDLVDSTRHTPGMQIDCSANKAPFTRIGRRHLHLFSSDSLSSPR